MGYYKEGSRTNRKDAIVYLGLLRDDGVTIRNDALKGIPETGLEQWLDRVDGWMREVITTIQRIDVADAVLFRTLDIVTCSPPAIPF